MVEQDDEILEAYLDGELGVEEARQLRERVSEDPALAGQLEELRRQRALRGRLFESMCGTESDTALCCKRLTAAVWNADRSRRYGRFMKTGGVVAASIAAGFLIGLLGRAATSGPLVADKSLAHPTDVAPVAGKLVSGHTPMGETMRAPDAGIRTMVMDPDGRIIGVREFGSAQSADHFSGCIKRYGEFGAVVIALRSDDPRNEELAGVKCKAALQVKNVASGSAADRSGLQTDDLIVGIDNDTIEDLVTFAERLGAMRDPFALRVVRGNEQVMLQAQFVR